MRNRKLVTIISILCGVVIIGAALLLTGVIELPFAEIKLPFGIEIGKPAEKEEPYICISYMDGYVSLNRKDMVISTSQEAPQGVPVIDGIELNRMLIGHHISSPDEEALEYVHKILEYADEYDINEISGIKVTASLEATVYARNIAIRLGYNKKTKEKLSDLADFYGQVLEMQGTLDMRQISEENLGYTFKMSAAPVTN